MADLNQCFARVSEFVTGLQAAGHTIIKCLVITGNEDASLVVVYRTSLGQLRLAKSRLSTTVWQDKKTPSSEIKEGIEVKK